MDEMLSSAAHGNDKGNQVWHPLPALPYVDYSIPTEGSPEAYSTSYDNPHIHTNIGIGVDGGNSLTADNGANEAEAGNRGGVQQNRDRHEIEPWPQLLVDASSSDRLSYPKEYLA